jgi:hypothetical protein
MFCCRHVSLSKKTCCCAGADWLGGWLIKGNLGRGRLYQLPWHPHLCQIDLLTVPIGRALGLSLSDRRSG